MTPRPRFRADRTLNIVESVIREMTRLAARHNAVNMAQGFPDFPAPQVLKQAAADAIAADINQYAITWGAKSFRDAIAAIMAWRSIRNAKSRFAAVRPKA
jgi:aminotransferase